MESASSFDVANRIRRWLRGLVPMSLRRQVSQWRRQGKDANAQLQFAGSKLSDSALADWVVVVEITQPILAAPFVDEKRHNLAKACRLLQGWQIRPGETLSFWRAIGSPDLNKGWKAGRTIINDVMTTDPGGGLCQLSSIVYHGGLLAGLEPIERYAHSLDFHQTDAARFTPLGLDATVFYGFKDLRLKNKNEQPLALSFALNDQSLTLRVYAPQTIEVTRLGIEREDHNDHRFVRVTRRWADGQTELISENHYSL